MTKPRFWDRKTPTISLALCGVIVVTSLIATWGRSPQNLAPFILMGAIFAAILNNGRIERRERERMGEALNGSTGTNDHGR